MHRAWERLCDANQSSAPLSTVAVLYAESQAWAALAVALRHVSPDQWVRPTTPASTLAAVPQRKPGRPPKPKAEPPDDLMAELRAKWQQEQADGA